MPPESVRRRRASHSNPQPRLSADERRDQIIDTARRVFTQAGFDGARTRDLAAAAGINEALLYRHFGSKEELFEAAVATPLEEAVSKVAESSGAPPEEFDVTGTVMYDRTYRFLYDLIGVMDEIGPLLGVMLFGHRDRASEYFRDRIDPTLNEIQRVVEANLSSWEHKEFDVGLMVRLTFGMIWFLGTSDRLCERKRDRAETAAAITSMLIHGVGTP